jgi:hypothetical protein
LKRIVAGAAIVAAIYATAPAAIAGHETALAKAAADLGFQYSYLGPEDAVALTKSGVTVVIRPGERLFDVNDRTEAMDGNPPRFSHSDIYISDALLRRLRAISAFYGGTPSGERPITVMQGPASGAAAVTGSITGLTLVQAPGKQEVSVGGKAPANAQITLTLIGTFSSEVPDVVLSRHEVLADVDGTFKTDLSVAPGYYRGGILTLVASSGPGISPAKAHIVMKAPNGNVSVPNDQEPRSIR